jgi:hypothetical protein
MLGTALLLLLTTTTIAATSKPALTLSDSTITVSTHYTAAGLSQLLSSISDPCTSGPVSISDTCRIIFSCSGGSVENANMRLSVGLQNSIAVISGGLEKRSHCFCTCGTYCCILCENVETVAEVPETVVVNTVDGSPDWKRSEGSVTAKFECT